MTSAPFTLNFHTINLSKSFANLLISFLKVETEITSKLTNGEKPTGERNLKTLLDILEIR